MVTTIGTTIILILYLVIGYLELADKVAERAVRKQVLPAVLVILALLYGLLTSVLLYLLGFSEDRVECLESVMFLFAALGLIGILLEAMHGGFHGIRPWNTGFYCYLALILVITVLGREGRNVSTMIYLSQPLRFLTLSGEEAGYVLRHFLLNATMFLPLGFLEPKGLRGGSIRVLDTFSIACVLSTAIETVQLAASIGQCDIDDVIANTLGFAGGLFLFFLVFGQENAEQAEDR